MCPCNVPGRMRIRRQRHVTVFAVKRGVELATRKSTWAHATCQVACAAACNSMSQLYCEKLSLPHSSQHAHMQCARLHAHPHATASHDLTATNFCLPHASQHRHMQCIRLPAQPYATACHSLTMKTLCLSHASQSWAHAMCQVACAAACNSMSQSCCEKGVLAPRTPPWAHARARLHAQPHAPVHHNLIVRKLCSTHASHHGHKQCARCAIAPMCHSVS